MLLVSFWLCFFYLLFHTQRNNTIYIYIFLSRVFLNIFFRSMFCKCCQKFLKLKACKKICKTVTKIVPTCFVRQNVSFLCSCFKKAEKNLHKNYLGTIEGETMQLLCRSFIKKCHSLLYGVFLSNC
jgi:hypothetical protein